MNKPINTTIEEWNTYLNVIRKVNHKELIVNELGLRRTLFDFKYFGSDLNKFITNNCTKSMTVNNIDLITIKNNIMRIIEFKNQYEQLKYNQNRLFAALAQIASTNNNKFCQYNLHIYVIRSNSPDFTENKIYNLIQNEIYIIGKKKLIDFLNYDYELASCDKLNELKLFK